MTGENTGDNPRRVLLKLSGEAFGGGKVGIDTSVIRRIAEEIVPAVQQGVQVAIVVGGGNFFRGAELQQAGIDRSRGDYMGMLGTVMNCLALQDFWNRKGRPRVCRLPSLWGRSPNRTFHSRPFVIWRRAAS